MPALDPREIDDLMMGCGQPGGEAGFNIGRAVAVELGYEFLPGTTVNRYCSSSLQTTRMAFHAIKAGEGSAFISAGVETVSRFPKGTSDGWPDSHNPLFGDAEQRSAQAAAGADESHDPREDGALPDVYVAMGTQTAENVALLTGISREEQDHWGVRSQNRTEEAIKSGFFEREIVPVTLPDGSTVSKDDGPGRHHIRGGEPAQAGVPTERHRDRGQCVPAERRRRGGGGRQRRQGQRLALKPLARIVATGVSGLSPEVMGLGPIEATRKALANAGMTIDDIDLYEINEAFAVQVLGSARELGMDSTTS